MIPFLLDALTVFFIVASLLLLRVGLPTPPREEAEECLSQAEAAVTNLDKEAWLRMADEWTKLAKDAEHQNRA